MNGRASATTESGYGRTLAGNNASEKIMSKPETYDGRAHSKRLTKTEYDPKIYPNPIAHGKLATRAAATIRTEVKVTINAGDVPNRA